MKELTRDDIDQIKVQAGRESEQVTVTREEFDALVYLAGVAVTVPYIQQKAARSFNAMKRIHQVAVAPV